MKGNEEVVMREARKMPYRYLIKAVERAINGTDIIEALEVETEEWIYDEVR